VCAFRDNSTQVSDNTYAYSPLPSPTSLQCVGIQTGNVLHRGDKELPPSEPLSSLHRQWTAKTSELNAADVTRAQRKDEPYVGTEHRPHRTKSDSLHPQYGTTPMDRSKAGSATYRPTYVRDHGNAQCMRLRTLLQKYRPTYTRVSRYDVRGPSYPPTLWDLPRHTHNSPTNFTKGRPCMEINSAGDAGGGQNSARHLPNDWTEHRQMMGHEDPRNPYSMRNETNNNVPQEAFAHWHALSHHIWLIILQQSWLSHYNQHRQCLLVIQNTTTQVRVQNVNIQSN